MKIFSANPAARMAWPWYCWEGATLVSLGCLLSCGGQGSAAGSDIGVLTSPPEVLTSPPEVLTSPTVLQGAYQTSLAGNDFVSFVTPATETKLYALYFLATNQNVEVLPAILSGTVALGQNGAAEVASPALKLFANTTPNLRSGSGTFSLASKLSYQLQFVGLTTADGQTPTFSASALVTSANLRGTWTGTWADSATNSTRKYSNITFETTATPTAWDFFSYCQAGSTLTLTPATYTQLGGTEKFFHAKLSMPQITLCDRTKTASVELTGVAFIYVLPEDTSKRRLELVLVDSTGSGISFRGIQ